MPNPETNSDNLPQAPLTEEQRFLFDTRGWLLIPGVLGESEVQEMREFCYRLKTGTAIRFPSTTAIPSEAPWRA